MTDARQRWVRAGLGLLAVSFLAAGLWAIGWPASFAGDFPRLGRHWVGADGPFDADPVRNVGVTSIAVGVILLLATLWAAADRRVIQAALLAAAVHNVLLLAVRIGDLDDTFDSFETAVAYGSLLLVAVLAVVLLAIAAKSIPEKEPAARDDDGFISDYEKFQIEYQTVNALILHYSNVRSALASFLITVALAAFAAYYTTVSEIGDPPFWEAEEGADLLAFAGCLVLVAAIIASFYFTYYTERTIKYSTLLWNWAVNGTQKYPGGFRGRWRDDHGKTLTKGAQWWMVWKRVFRDVMNWVLFVGAVVLGVAFFVFEHRS